MSARTSASRYARALLDVALKEADPQQIERDLTTFATALHSSAELQRALINPRIPAATRRALVDAVTRRIAMAAPAAKLLMLLAERGRLELFDDLLAVYRERLLAHSNIVKGSVTSAAPLAKETVRALEHSLTSATGKNVQLDVAVDPSIIGGVIARIGSTVYDGSIRSKLARMKQQLIENA